MTFDSGRPTEARCFGRRDANHAGWILVPGRARQHCVVRNMSQGGAMLECDRPQTLPMRFELLVEATGAWYACEIRQRSKEAVGVQFVENASISAKASETKPTWRRANRPPR